MVEVKPHKRCKKGADRGDESKSIAVDRTSCGLQLDIDVERSRYVKKLILSISDHWC